jgi:hypothetical protein
MNSYEENFEFIRYINQVYQKTLNIDDPDEVIKYIKRQQEHTWIRRI